MPKGDWYDNFAPLYDAGTISDFFYRQPRKTAVGELQLSRSDRVMDVFCGTGVDFKLLQEKIGTAGYITAVDGSKGMLDQATKRSRKIGLGESSIQFLQADLSSSEGIEKICASIKKNRPKSIMFSLGLTCLPNWHEFTSRVFDAAVPGTRLAIMDVYSEKLSFGARFINWIGAADCRRPVWQALQEKSQSFTWQEFRPFKVLDVSVIVASGTKPDVV